MSAFSERLRSEINFAGLTRKELAEKAGIKTRALDMYLGTQESMPPADVAVKIACALKVSVEYLVTGKDPINLKNISRYAKYQDFFDALFALPNEIFASIRTQVKIISQYEKKSGSATLPTAL